MHLEKLLDGMNGVEVVSKKSDADISHIAYDSRRVGPGGLFVCIKGYKLDGHDFIKDALDRGAAAILVEKEVEQAGNAVLAKHPNTRKALAEISAKFYGNPSQKFNLIGVTGTKGKTTTTFMVKSILERRGYKVGLIGTIANYIGDKVIPADRTTPESLDLQQIFSEMVKQRVDAVVMEISSHSLELYRVQCSDFDVGVFTNLSQDHLDFHLNFENYFAAKAKLFSMCKRGAINADDQYGQRLLQSCSCEAESFGINNKADVGAENIRIKPEGTTFELVSDNQLLEVSIPIPGKFSVYNALAAVTACKNFNITSEDIVEGLKELKVPGRAETIDTDLNFTVMVDYAHSPGSLENILQAVNTYASGRVVAVFGCGGDRDRTKRPIMGEIAGRLAHFSILTADNPRSENPEAIILEIEEGIKRAGGEYIIISDRRQAIEYAIKNAKENDIILIAGKGHETYQVYKDKTIEFDDREVALEVIRSLKRKDGF